MPTKKKKLDPKQVFVVQSVTREEIAERFNEIRKNENWRKYRRFTASDSRLTDKVCKDFTDAIACASTDLDEIVDREYQYQKEVLGDLLDVPFEEEDDEKEERMDDEDDDRDGTQGL